MFAFSAISSDFISNNLCTKNCRYIASASSAAMQLHISRARDGKCPRVVYDVLLLLVEKDMQP